MKNTKQTQREARQIFRTCLVGGVLDEQRTRQVVALIGQKKLRGSGAILTRLHRLVKLELARRSVRVESAVQATPEEMSSIHASLTKKYGAGLSFEFVVNPALLGGVRIQVGSDLYDGSVKTRLEKLEQSF